MHIFRTQCFKTWTESQEKIWKEHKYLAGKNILLKNEWVNQEIKEEFKKYMETYEKENTTVQNL